MAMGIKNIRFIPWAVSCGIWVKNIIYKMSITPPPSPKEAATPAMKATIKSAVLLIE